MSTTILYSEDISSDENIPPTSRTPTADKLNTSSNKRSILQESQITNVSMNISNLVEATNKLSTPQKFECNDSGSEWKERNEIITKLDHDNNLNCVTEILSELLDKLSLDDDDEFVKTISADSFVTCPAVASNLNQGEARSANELETEADITFSVYESCCDGLSKSDSLHSLEFNEPSASLSFEHNSDKSKTLVDCPDNNKYELPIIAGNAVAHESSVVNEIQVDKTVPSEIEGDASLLSQGDCSVISEIQEVFVNRTLRLDSADLSGNTHLEQSCEKPELNEVFERSGLQSINAIDSLNCNSAVFTITEDFAEENHPLYATFETKSSDLNQDSIPITGELNHFSISENILPSDIELTSNLLNLTTETNLITDLHSECNCLKSTDSNLPSQLVNLETIDPVWVELTSEDSRSGSPPIVTKKIDLEEILDNPHFNPFTGGHLSPTSDLSSTEIDGDNQTLISLHQLTRNDNESVHSGNITLEAIQSVKELEKSLRAPSPQIQLGCSSTEIIGGSPDYNCATDQIIQPISQSSNYLNATDSEIENSVELKPTSKHSIKTVGDNLIDDLEVLPQISQDSGYQTTQPSATTVDVPVNFSFVPTYNINSTTEELSEISIYKVGETDFNINEIEQLQLDATKVIQEIAHLSQECINFEENLIVQSKMTSVFSTSEIQDSNHNVTRDDDNCNITHKEASSTEVLSDGCKIETEAGPDIAPFAEEDFRPGEEALKDYENIGHCKLEDCLKSDTPEPSIYRDSLYVKFDPLFSNRAQQAKPVSAVHPQLKSVTESGNESDHLLLINSADRAPNKVRNKVGDELISITPTSSPGNKQISMPPWISSRLQKNEDSENFVQKINDLKLQHQEELLSKDKYYEDKLSTHNKDMDKLKKKLKDTETALMKVQKSEKQMSEIVNEYEKTLSQLISEKDKSESEYVKAKEEAEKERDQALQDLRSVEVAFNTFNSKYERAKAAVEDLKKNEEALKKTVCDLQSQVKRQENKYELLKQHAEDKLSQANKEIEVLKKNHEGEIARLTAMYKKSEMRAASLEKSLEQKTKECEEMSSICDELINRV